MSNQSPSAAPLSPLLSPTTAALSPTWRPPKSPLPPHRLAKLANALGVSTPIPAGHGTNAYFPRSFSDSSSPVEQLRRSPTPSTAASPMTFSPYQPSTSKFLLHVIPPIHLPHDFDSTEESEVPPPPNAPGYHTQFRRGTLVPVHSTLQAQLGAIAKEYALPSASGLILYLVTTAPFSQQTDGMDEPGPRLSEDIWKHLWTRILRSEQRDDILLPSISSRSTTPQTPRTPLALAPAARSTPFLPQENNGPLRPFLSTSSDVSPALSPQPIYPLATSPSTPSSISDIRSNNKSAPPSSTSLSQSEPDTPNTSVDDSGLRGNFLDLPGLNSPSLIPILAKVEFDIDRRKAAWYEPWLRSRKVNHAKRTASRKNSKSSELNGNGGEESARERVPIEFLTGKKDKSDPFGLRSSSAVEREELESETTVLDVEPLKQKQEEEMEVESETTVLDVEPLKQKQEEEMEVEGGLVGEEVGKEADGDGYARLTESPEEEEHSDSDSDSEEFAEDTTARVTSLPEGKDPLADVFGTDADTWADIRSENGEHKGDNNPNIVNLALTAAELDRMPHDGFDDDETKSTKEEDEVIEMLDMMGNPQLAMQIPSPEKSTNKRSSSPSGGVSGRKVPPPLVLKIKDNKPSATVVASTPTSVTEDGARLAYLGDSPDHPDGEYDDEDNSTAFENYTRIRSPESDKRVGAVFDDLDLGLDPTEDFDDDDPNDRRRSQYLMRAQLDEIEKTMAQLSPRILKTDLEEEQNMSLSSAGLSPRSPGNISLSPGSIRNSDFLPPSSPRLPRHPDPPENPMYYAGETWPAVPFSAIKERENPSANPNAPPSPPRLAVNGVTTSAPRSFMPTNRPAQNKGLSESEQRKGVDNNDALYPPPSPSLVNHDSTAESPVIPLSPDPFGRHPSSPEPPYNSIHMTGSQWDTMTMGKGIPPEPTLVQGRARSGTTTSRFSADSFKGEDAASIANAGKSQNRTTLMSVKSIKKLWRKSNKSSGSAHPNPPPPTPTVGSSGRVSPMVPQRPERPSEEQLDLPDVPELPNVNVGRLLPQPMAPPPPPPPSSAPRTSIEQMQQGRRPSQEQQILPPPPPAPVNMGRLSPQPVQGPPRVDSMQGSRNASVDYHMAPPRQSLEQLGYPPQQHQQQQQQPQPNFQQLSVPSYQGRNANHAPIMTPHMQAAKAASGLDRLHFDQESPYPTRVRQSPRPPSPPPLPAIPEQEKNIARKSILRWKSAAASTTAGSAPTTPIEPQPRLSYERPGVNGNSRGGRRPNVVNFGSTRASVTSPELPPSPQIPTQFMPTKTGLDHRQSQRSRLTTSSTDSSYSPPQRQSSLQSQSSLGARSSSPPRSMTSSRDSQGSRPSFDASQFEFVSPKGGSLSYPYNSIDH